MAADPSTETVTFRELHWSHERHGPITRLCEGAFRDAPDLRSVAHFSSGILDFVVRRRGSAPLSILETHSSEDLHDESLPGSRLLLCTQDLGALIRPLGTGDLMRVVVGNDLGGLWGGRVKPGEYVAAVTGTHDGVPGMDAAMNRLVTRIRADVYRLPDEMPGGTTPVDELDEPRTDQKLHTDFGTAADQEREVEMRLRDLWGRHVNVHDLQYAALYRDWKLVCAGDAFEDPDVAPRFLDVSVRARRTAYRVFAQSLRGHLVRLNDALRLVVRPPADRLVVDVQEGALFVSWLSPEEYLVGVTLDQGQVGHAEKRLGLLAADLRGLTAPEPR